MTDSAAPMDWTVDPVKQATDTEGRWVSRAGMRLLVGRGDEGPVVYCGQCSNDRQIVFHPEGAHRYDDPIR